MNILHGRPYNEPLKTIKKKKTEPKAGFDPALRNGLISNVRAVLERRRYKN